MPPSHRDQQFLDDLREALEASVDFFSPHRKCERELWDCEAFLSNLSVSFEASELLPQVDDPPDVVFRDARFETKEIMDPGRRRHQEYKEALAKAKSAKDPREMLEEYHPQYLTPEEIGSLVQAELDGLVNRYEPQLVAKLDLLFYVNLKSHSIEAGPMPQAARFAPYGWRSVSAFIRWGALVLFAAPDAPEFIRERVGTLTFKEFS